MHFNEKYMYIFFGGGGGWGRDNLTIFIITTRSDDSVEKRL